MAQRKLKSTNKKSNTVDQVRDSANQIWLAGLGAFSKAQAEGGKFFDSLVSEGRELDKKTRSKADKASSEVESRVQEARKSAGQSWDKLETVFEERVSKVLGRLGVPSKSDVDALSERIDSLHKEIKSLEGSMGAAKAKRTTSTRKPAASKSTASKASSSTSKSTASKSTSPKSSS